MTDSSYIFELIESSRKSMQRNADMFLSPDWNRVFRKIQTGRPQLIRDRLLADYVDACPQQIHDRKVPLIYRSFVCATRIACTPKLGRFGGSLTHSPNLCAMSVKASSKYR